MTETSGRYEEMPEQQGSSARVLIVSGEGRHRETLAAAARKSGWKAALCATVDGAEMLLARGHYDAVLCEDTLPDGNFTAVMTFAERFAAGTPLVVVSRRDEWENYMAALAAGAVDYLAFPPYPGEVEHSLEKAGRLSRLLAHAA
jgi:DNA-binding response OmpR family regulator